jgi:predicted Rossmann fold flavoprotein
MMAQKNICIIGGGASGMMAAIAAARSGAKVILLEQLNRVGKKLLATGNGRCNLTNVDPNIERYHSSHPEFPKDALSQFGYDETIAFFEELGIAHKVEELGKVFPYSDQASSVLDVIRWEMEKLGIEERVDCEVIAINPSKKGFSLVLKNDEQISADAVILATGGKANPNLGSTGSGYILARKLGHSITSTFPSLVQLNLNASFLRALKGIKFIGTAAIYDGEACLCRDDGEILFTDYGISGPPIFQLSRSAGELLIKNRKPTLMVDMFPKLTEGQLTEALGIRFICRPSKSAEFSLVGMLNKRLIPTVLREAGITDLSRTCGSISQAERASLAAILKGWSFQVTGTQSWGQAQVTAGGVDVTEVNPNTMESRLVPGLYLCGELLDVDGDCGGFNLQWAWSSGYCAGVNAAAL